MIPLDDFMTLPIIRKQNLVLICELAAIKLLLSQGISERASNSCLFLPKASEWRK